MTVDAELEHWKRPVWLERPTQCVDQTMEHVLKQTVMTTLRR